MRTITASERSAMIRLAATLPVGSPERRALIAGCEKLPNKAMQENCEAKKEEGKKKEAGCEKLPNEKMQQMCEDKKEEGADKKAGDVPAELKKHQFTSEDNPNPKGNDKDGDGKTNEPSPVKSKKADQHEESKEKYPWDECIKQQTEAYSAEAAPKICGKIRAESQGRSASPKAALVRLAAALPVGSDERKTIIRMASGLQKQAGPDRSLMNKAHSLLERGTKRLRTHDVFGDVYELLSRTNGDYAVFYFVGGERKKRDLEQAAKKALAPISDQIEDMSVRWTQDVMRGPLFKQHGVYDELRVEVLFR